MLKNMGLIWINFIHEKKKNEMFEPRRVEMDVSEPGNLIKLQVSRATDAKPMHGMGTWFSEKTKQPSYLMGFVRLVDNSTPSRLGSWIEECPCQAASQWCIFVASADLFARDHIYDVDPEINSTNPK